MDREEEVLRSKVMKSSPDDVVTSVIERPQDGKVCLGEPNVAVPVPSGPPLGKDITQVGTVPLPSPSESTSSSSSASESPQSSLPENPERTKPKRTSPKEQPVHCLLCNRKVLSRRSLVRHAKRLHPQEIQLALPKTKSQLLGKHHIRNKLGRFTAVDSEGRTEVEVHRPQQNGEGDGLLSFPLPLPMNGGHPGTMLPSFQTSGIFNPDNSLLFAPVVHMNDSILHLARLGQLCEGLLSQRRPILDVNPQATFAMRYPHPGLFSNFTYGFPHPPPYYQ
jgi:hypothetical protein